MPWYVQKPIVVEAVQNSPGNETLVVEFLNKHGLKWWVTSQHGIRVDTVEGVTQIAFDDWVVLGPLGEVFGVSNEIFQRTYEESQLKLFP